MVDFTYFGTIGCIATYTLGLKNNKIILKLNNYNSE